LVLAALLVLVKAHFLFCCIFFSVLVLVAFLALVSPFSVFAAFLVLLYHFLFCCSPVQKWVEERRESRRGKGGVIFHYRRRM
jgi:hypothetical protein